MWNDRSVLQLYIHIFRVEPLVRDSPEIGTASIGPIVSLVQRFHYSVSNDQKAAIHNTMTRTCKHKGHAYYAVKPLTNRTALYKGHLVLPHTNEILPPNSTKEASGVSLLILVSIFPDTVYYPLV